MMKFKTTKNDLSRDWRPRPAGEDGILQPRHFRNDLELSVYLDRDAIDQIVGEMDRQDQEGDVHVCIVTNLAGLVKEALTFHSACGGRRLGVEHSAVRGLKKGLQRAIALCDEALKHPDISR